MGPFSERVSLVVPPPPRHHHQGAPDPELPVPSVQTVLTQTWFVSIIGVLAIFLIITAVGFVYVKRRFATDKHFDHYDGKGRYNIFERRRRLEEENKIKLF